MARTKEVKPDGKVHILPPKRKPKAQAKNADQHPDHPRYELAYNPPLRARNQEPLPLRSLNEENPPLRPLNKENPLLRASEEDITRLSSSSDEAVLDVSLSAPSSEQASSNAPESSPSAQHEQRVKTQWTVMSQGRETTTVMTLFGAARPPTVPLVHEDGKDENETEVDYEDDVPEEVVESASGSSALEGEHQAEGIEQTTTLVQELPSSHDKGKEEGENDTSDSPLSIASDLIMIEHQDTGSPAAAKAKPVLNAKDIMSIVERKDISIKTPVPDHNPQRKGLEDNLFDFGDALCDYTSDGGTIRINQGLATLMLIAATAEAQTVS
jgi:hypothetical protein